MAKDTAPAKLSKEMKASVDKMVAKVQDWASKKFTSIEKQLEKMKGDSAKAKVTKGKAEKKTKPMKVGKKKGRNSKKTAKAANQQTEAA
jgi:hypothetical protein